MRASPSTKHGAPTAPSPVWSAARRVSEREQLWGWSASLRGSTSRRSLIRNATWCFPGSVLRKDAPACYCTCAPSGPEGFTQIAERSRRVTFRRRSKRSFQNRLDAPSWRPSTSFVWSPLPHARTGWSAEWQRFFIQRRHEVACWTQAQTATNSDSAATSTYGLYLTASQCTVWTVRDYKATQSVRASGLRILFDHRKCETWHVSTSPRSHLVAPWLYTFDQWYRVFDQWYQQCVWYVCRCVASDMESSCGTCAPDRAHESNREFLILNYQCCWCRGAAANSVCFEIHTLCLSYNIEVTACSVRTASNAHRQQLEVHRSVILWIGPLTSSFRCDLHRNDYVYCTIVCGN